MRMLRHPPAVAAVSMRRMVAGVLVVQKVTTTPLQINMETERTEISAMKFFLPMGVGLLDTSLSLAGVQNGSAAMNQKAELVIK